MSRRLCWYGVKTLYRAAPVGRRRGTDRLYSGDVTLVEERVVLVRARNSDEAIRKAGREATRYAADSHRNPYGQLVRTRRLGYVDAFIIGSELGDGVEVYSETEIVSRRVPDRSIADRLIGRPESKRIHASRRNILDFAFNAPAPGVKPTRSERELRGRFMSPKKR